MNSSAGYLMQLSVKKNCCKSSCSLPDKGFFSKFLYLFQSLLHF